MYYTGGTLHGTTATTTAQTYHSFMNADTRCLPGYMYLLIYMYKKYIPCFHTFTFTALV